MLVLLEGLSRKRGKFGKTWQNQLIVKVFCEHLPEPSTGKVFDTHFWENISHILREGRDIESEVQQVGAVDANTLH